MKKRNGYGIIYKPVITNGNISAKAKAMYAYLACYGENIYPSRDTVIKELHISKTSYYKYLDELVSSGVVSIKKKLFGRNTYILKKWDKSAGYGIMPRRVAMDGKISMTAKSIYACISVFAGAAGTAFPSASLIISQLGISESTFYTHFRSLLSYGFIDVVSVKKDGGTLQTDIKSIFLMLLKHRKRIKNCTPKNSTRKIGTLKNGTSILILTVIRLTVIILIIMNQRYGRWIREAMYKIKARRKSERLENTFSLCRRKKKQ